MVCSAHGSNHIKTGGSPHGECCPGFAHSAWLLDIFGGYARSFAPVFPLLRRGGGEDQGEEVGEFRCHFLSLSLALWNGKGPILKERLFGLTYSEGNHSEDEKELYYQTGTKAAAFF